MEIIFALARLFILGPLMVISFAVGVKLLFNSNIYEEHSISGAINQAKPRYKMHVVLGILIGALVQITELLI